MLLTTIIYIRLFLPYTIKSHTNISKMDLQPQNNNKAYFTTIFISNEDNLKFRKLIKETNLCQIWKNDDCIENNVKGKKIILKFAKPIFILSFGKHLQRENL